MLLELLSLPKEIAMDQKLKAPHIPAKAKTGIYAALAAIGMFFAMAAVPLACDKSETKEVKPEKTAAELEAERKAAEKAAFDAMTPEEHVAQARKLLEEAEELLNRGNKQMIEASKRMSTAGSHIDAIPEGHPLKNLVGDEFDRKWLEFREKRKKIFG
jgi:hypothetical protein